MSKRFKKWMSFGIVICLLATMIPMTIVSATESDVEQNISANTMEGVSDDSSVGDIDETSENQVNPEVVSEEVNERIQGEDEQEVEAAETETVETETAETETAETETAETETAETETTETETTETETVETGDTIVEEEDSVDNSHIQHEYTCDRFIWSEDKSSCQAELSCLQCGETKTVDCEIIIDYYPYAKYCEAVAFVDDKSWSNQQYLVEVQFIWNKNFSQCTAKVNDYEKDVYDTKECNISSEIYADNNAEIQYKAEIEYDGSIYYSYNYGTNPAIGTNNGHMWYQYNDGSIDIRGFSDNALIQTSFDDKYYTVLRVDEEDNQLSFTGNNIPVTINGLSVTPQLSFSNNGKYVVVTYIVKNNTNIQKTFSLNFNSDVDIDTDDYATVNVTNTGIEMKNSENNTAYYIACKNVSGIKNVNTIWIGFYNERWGNLFNNSGIISLRDTDSGFAAAWTNQTLNPGSSTTYSYEVGLGTGESIDAPEEHTHAYEPFFKWSDDCNECEVEFICSGCHTSQSANCDVIIEKVDDLLVYTASANYNGKEYTDMRTNAVIEILEDSAGGRATIATHTVGSGESISLWCTIPLEYFASVEVDGQVVDQNNYTLKSGSTILTFSSAYLDTLRSGNHEVKMNYNINGRAVGVSTNIKIVNEQTDAAQEPTSVFSESPESKTDDLKTAAKYNPVKMVTNIVDKDDKILTGYTLALDSTSKSVAINDRGEASFNGIDSGDHILYLQDSKGNVIASKKVKIVWDDAYAIEGDIIHVKGNQSFGLKVKYNGRELVLVSVGPVSNPMTGDTNRLWIWVALLCVSYIVANLARKKQILTFSKK